MSWLLDTSYAPALTLTLVLCCAAAARDAVLDLQHH